jgi:rhamnogalacturonyl hydrolase YesR/beta-glucanase (GH16 family)
MKFNGSLFIFGLLCSVILHTPPVFAVRIPDGRSDTLPDREEVCRIIRRVNDYWQQNHPAEKWAFWDVAAYHTGNMEVYAVTGDEKYRAYSERWAEHNRWMGARSQNRKEWKYSYGERDNYVLFGDWQICFQTYIDLYNIDPDPRKIARAREVMEYQMSTPQKDYWWWADGLYMVMPVITKLYKLTGDPLYLKKLGEYHAHAESIMYDAKEKLYYRDGKYVWPKHKTINGKKDFWARGDGWVFAALCKVLQDLPQDDPQRDHFIRRYRDMAGAIAASQQPKGYWSRSLLDPRHAPGYETSGTAFFTYGLFWGINNGLLDPAEYLPAALKGWEYLSVVALQSDGKVGFIQPIGEKAVPGQQVDVNSTSSFGVGAFLLAACELTRYLDTKEGWRLVWQDEFEKDGRPDPEKWSYETGFVRNRELQWYQPENARCENGCLVIEGKKERVANPRYRPNSNDWKREREYAEYTSACVKTPGKAEFLYGRFEIRARIPVADGCWPAIWTLGRGMAWPSNGEVDIMEYYRIDGIPHILANFAWGTDRPGEARWRSRTVPFDYFLKKDPDWASRFHTWRMDWDEKMLKLYLDDELLNEISLDEVRNGAPGNHANPFRQPHYILLNLAIGGMHGGTPGVAGFPARYEIDYVRVYQKG